MISIFNYMKKFLFSLFVASLLVACEKEVIPVLGTLSVTIDENNPEVVTCSVEVTEGSVAECGFYCDKSKNKVTGDKAAKVAGNYVAPTIQGEIKGLTPNETYYIKAYATNEVGVGYSEIVKIKTAARMPGAGDNQYPGTSK